MSAADVPFLLLLAGPGFLLIQFRAWSSADARLSDLQRTLWSVLCSVALFFGLHGVLRHIAGIRVGAIASPETLLGDPAATPIGFIVCLYLIGALAGWALGKAERSDQAVVLLKKIGLDPRRNHDVWDASFRISRSVTIVLHDGAIYRGWATDASSGGAQRRYVRLERASHWKSERTDWSPVAGSILIPEQEMSRLFFHSMPAREPQHSLRRNGGAKVDAEDELRLKLAAHITPTDAHLPQGGSHR